MKGLMKIVLGIAILLMIYGIIDCSNDGPDIEVRDAEIEIVGDSAYVTLNLLNKSKKDSIVRLDLLNNKDTSGEIVYIFAQDCCILPQDSSKVYFRIHYDVNKILPDFVIRTERIVSRYSGGKLKRYSQPSKGLYVFGLCKRDREKRAVKVEEDHSFKFLGEGRNRKENFDEYPGEVTEENVRQLYREYNVSKIPSSDLYLVASKRMYSTARYLARLLKFENGKQVAAITYYGWNIPYVFVQGDKYLIGMNSLFSNSGMDVSTFTCKTVLLDNSLKPINERIFRYKEQRDAYYAYCYIDTLFAQKNGYGFKVINRGFDADDYFVYEGLLNFSNKVVSSSKKQVFKQY